MTQQKLSLFMITRFYNKSSTLREATKIRPIFPVLAKNDTIPFKDSLTMNSV